MKPRLDLLIHPGLPKTATTWFQTGVLPRLPTVVNIGKGGASVEYEDVRPVSRELRAKQYRVFSEVHDGESMYRRYRSSLPDLLDYRDCAVDLLARQRSHREIDGHTVVVLSDETLGTSGGIEVNLGLLAGLITAFRDALDDEFDVHPHVVFTVREQKAWLQSYYAFSSRHLFNRHPDVHKFIAEGATDPQGGVFGMLHFDQTFQMVRLALAGMATVRLVPSEILSTCGGSAFVRQLLHFLGDEDPVLELARMVADELTDAAINAAPRDGSATIALNRSRGAFSINSAARSFSAITRRHGPVGALTRPLRGPLRLAYRAFFETRLNDLGTGRGISVELSEEDSATIDEIFAASNAEFARQAGIDLSALGYHCA